MFNEQPRLAVPGEKGKRQATDHIKGNFGNLQKATK
jgi:hypothetical protein